ncbi:type II toxin-antitoxin system VapC family toxin [Sphingomonas bacterium]|uniref:type II toxin-antitoxin system VapC family toxin n=1 Tax=Sphingomonas bacterium TaxID=1895847 RepID=UPI0015756CB2|nr:type II toxin-antitoxin system VapC family toxin [Sphingomonas bacterium]
MAGVILDTSAVLALLRDEPGAKKVATVLSGSRMSVVNHAELVSYYAKAGSDRAAVEGMLRALPIELVPADRDLAVAAGLLRAVTAEAGLSLGDRFCLALAAREGLVALTADRAWKDVAAACGVKVTVIR